MIYSDRSHEGLLSRKNVIGEHRSDAMDIFAPFADRIRFGVFTRQSMIHDERAAANQLGTLHVAYPDQIHGKKVEIVHEGNLGNVRCDGLITDTPCLALSVCWADCQNFLVYAPRKHILGVIHAGWRGMAQKIITEFYRVLKKKWDIDPENTYVFAGPSLCMCCTAFTAPWEELPPRLHQFIP